MIYSESTAGSKESKHLAYYLCGQLASTGYANVHMVGLTSDGMPGQLPSSSTERITYMPRGNSTKKIEVPASDVTFSHFDVLAQSHVIIVTVNSEDTKLCRTKMQQILDEKRQNKDTKITIFSLQRGVKNSQAIKAEFDGRKDIAVIEGAVGFAVVPHPKNRAFVPTVRDPSILFERLDKEAERIAEGPCNLLECMDVEVYYRKTLTPYTWGVLVWENLHSVNMLTGGSMLSTLRNPRARLILASMVREAAQTLRHAARGGDWKPDFLLLSEMLSPRLFELLLCLPTQLFLLLLALFGLTPQAEGLMSPMLIDHLEGRKSCNETQLGEIVTTADRYNCIIPVSTAVYKVISDLDAGKGRRSAAAAGAKGTKGDDKLDMVESEVVASLQLLAKASPADDVLAKNASSFRFGMQSKAKLLSHVKRFCIFASMLVCLYILFVHEHEHEEELEALVGHLDQETL